MDNHLDRHRLRMKKLTDIKSSIGYTHLECIVCGTEIGFNEAYVGTVEEPTCGECSFEKDMEKCRNEKDN